MTLPSTALAALAADMKAMDRRERSDMLIEYADQFEEVPAAVATRPFAERNRAPRCESDAYVWATDNPDGTLKFHFAVENPQGVSAKAWAAILDETLSGHTPEQILTTDPELLFDIFGRDLSMGKGQGLLGMLELIQHEARRRLDARRAG